jgi:nuclear transport factor 2 (NTF2) superfamily protein
MPQSGENQGIRPPVPPFDEETAREKVKAAQDSYWTMRSHSLPRYIALIANAAGY